MNVTKQTETVVKHTVTLEMSEQEFQAFCYLMAYSITVADAIHAEHEETEKAVLFTLMHDILQSL